MSSEHTAAEPNTEPTMAAMSGGDADAAEATTAGPPGTSAAIPSAPLALGDALPDGSSAPLPEALGLAELLWEDVGAVLASAATVALPALALARTLLVHAAVALAELPKRDGCDEREGHGLLESSEEVDE